MKQQVANCSRRLNCRMVLTTDARGKTSTGFSNVAPLSGFAFAINWLIKKLNAHPFLSKAQK
ncbi:hypothetical protein KVMX100_110062 [Klebsiella variicola]|nr:hypothetical protein KVMX100_110062 [Klebsiella variicola]